MTETSKEKYMLLERMLCIYYPFCFWKNTASIKTLIDLGSKINIMIIAYKSKLGLKVYHTNISDNRWLYF